MWFLKLKMIFWQNYNIFQKIDSAAQFGSAGAVQQMYSNGTAIAECNL